MTLLNHKTMSIQLHTIQIPDMLKDCLSCSDMVTGSWMDASNWAAKWISFYSTEQGNNNNNNKISCGTSVALYPHLCMFISLLYALWGELELLVCNGWFLNFYLPPHGHSGLSMSTGWRYHSQSSPKSLYVNIWNPGYKFWKGVCSNSTASLHIFLPQTIYLSFHDFTLHSGLLVTYPSLVQLSLNTIYYAQQCICRIPRATLPPVSIYAVPHLLCFLFTPFSPLWAGPWAANW